MNTSPLRPVGQLLSNSWELFSRGFKKYASIIAISFVAVIPWFIAGMVDSEVIALGIFIVGIAGFIVYFIGMLGLTYAIADGGVSSVSTYYRMGRQKALSYLWAEILSGLIVLAGIILLIIPGIMWGISYSLATYVVLFEPMKGMSALRQSKAYIKGNWWKVFWRYILLGIVLIPVAVLSALPGESAGGILSQLVSSFVITPFSLAYIYLIYKDLKAAKMVQAPVQEQVAQPVIQ